MIPEPLEIQDHRQCQLALEELRAHIEQIANLLESRAPSRSDQEQARSLLTELKKQLNDYVARADSDRVQAQMSDFERAIYAPAVIDVLRDKLLVRTNTTPGPNWYEHLYDAAGTVGWYLQNLLSIDPVESRLRCERCGELRPDVRIRLNPIASLAGTDVFAPLCDQCFSEGGDDF